MLLFRKQALLWALGDAERAKALPKHHRSDKLSKQDKLDKLEKLEKLESSERMDRLDALMLKKISGMELDEVCIQVVCSSIVIGSRGGHEILCLTSK